MSSGGNSVRVGQATTQRASWVVTAVLLVTLAGAAVRVAFLSHPMRYDEAWNFLQFSSRAPTYIVTHYAPNNHVLHTLCVRFASHWLGTSPAALRVPTLVVGILLIPLSAWTAWRLMGDRRTALLTAVMVAACSHMVEYSANSRGYLMLTLFVLLQTLCTLKLLELPQRWRWWLAWALVGALGAYTMPIMLYPFAGLCVVLVLGAIGAPRRSERRRGLVRGLAVGVPLCGVVTVGLYAPALVAQGLAATWQTREHTTNAWNPVVGSRMGALVEMWRLASRDASWAWCVVLVGGLVAYVRYLVRHPSLKRALPLIMVGVAVLVVLAQGVLLRDRVWLFAAPLIFACCAHGVLHVFPERVMRRWGGAPTRVVTALVVMTGVLVLLNVYREPYLCAEPDVIVDAERIVAECRASGLERYAVVMRYTPSLGYYLQRAHVPTPVGPADAERVYIMADKVRSLAAQWHPGVEGYEHFEAPHLVRRLGRGVLYAADRLPGAADVKLSRSDGPRG